MSGKVIDVRAGDRWTKDSDGDLWLYRGDRCFAVCKTGCGIDSDGVESYRYPSETDLPTPEAHAQLREWGYEIRGEQQQHTTGFITTSPVIGGATWTLPPNTEPTKTLGERVAALESELSELKKDAEDDDASLYYTLGFIDTRQDNIEARIAKLEAVIESRVREIVEEVLAAKPTPAEIDEAVRIANDPKTVWHDVNADDWRARCRVWQPTPDEKTKWAVHSPSRKCHLVLDDPLIGTGWYVSGEGYGIGRNFNTEADARAALAKAPPPPDVADFNGKEAVAPEPDWKGLLEAVCDAADFVIDTDETPERNCSCHIHPPCSDCEEYAGRRQAIDELNAALAAAREYLARTNGGVK